MIEMAVLPADTFPAIPERHPLARVNAALWFWLVCIILILMWNAAVGTAILLHGWLRPLPFLFVAGVAVVWLFSTHSAKLTIVCSAVIAVGISLRAAELLLYAGDLFELRARLSGASVWLLVGVTTLVFGFLNIVAISRRQADLRVWGGDGGTG